MNWVEDGWGIMCYYYYSYGTMLYGVVYISFSHDNNTIQYVHTTLYLGILTLVTREAGSILL